MMYIHCEGAVYQSLKHTLCNFEMKSLKLLLEKYTVSVGMFPN